MLRRRASRWRSDEDGDLLPRHVRHEYLRWRLRVYEWSVWPDVDLLQSGDLQHRLVRLYGAAVLQQLDELQERWGNVVCVERVGHLHVHERRAVRG